MIDAYAIGTRLALDNGVSEGIATIGRDLTALDQAVGASVDGIASIAKLAEELQAPSPEPQVPMTLAAAALSRRAGLQAQSEPTIVFKVPPTAAPAELPRDIPPVAAELDDAPSPPQLAPSGITDQPPLQPQTPLHRAPAAAHIIRVARSLPAAPAASRPVMRLEPVAPEEPDFDHAEATASSASPIIPPNPVLPTAAPGRMQGAAGVPIAMSVIAQSAAYQPEPLPTLPPTPITTATHSLGRTASRPPLVSLAVAPQPTATRAEIVAPTMASILI